MHRFLFPLVSVLRLEISVDEFDRFFLDMFGNCQHKAFTNQKQYAPDDLVLSNILNIAEHHIPYNENPESRRSEPCIFPQEVVAFVACKGQLHGSLILGSVDVYPCIDHKSVGDKGYNKTGSFPHNLQCHTLVSAGLC